MKKTGKSLLNDPKTSILRLLNKYGIFFVAILLFVIASFLSPVFLTQKNLINVLRQVSVFALLAYGETMLIIGGTIDLSVGSALALCGIISIDSYMVTGNIFLGALSGIVLGGLIGAVNGYMVGYIGILPFITTLAMDMALRGLVLLYTGGQPIVDTGNFAIIGQGSLGPIPTPVIIMALMGIVTWYILKQTTFGRKIYAMGGNVDAAIASGINVKRTKFLNYIISGMLFGLGGVVLMSRLNSGIPTAGIGYHGEAISASIIGGASTTGGVGSVTGTITGTLIVGIITNILSLTGVNAYIRDIVKGLIILAAVVLDMRSKKKKI